MVAGPTQVTSLLKLLGDPTRLRILALVEREELSVGELSRALDMSQSRVSNHLRLLREADLVTERRDGTSTRLRLAAPTAGDVGLVAALWPALRPELATIPEHGADLARLAELVEERELASREFFDRVARDWDTIGVDFETGAARERSTASLLSGEEVFGDIGCGTGYLSASLLGLCRRLVCVDRSPAMLRQARERLSQDPRGTVVELRRGELHELPIDDGELDGLVCGMVLHHVPRADDALAEMHRVLRPGGRVVVLDLKPHAQEWVRGTLGDHHLGLQPGELAADLSRAGFEHVRLEPVHDAYRPTAPETVGSADGRARLPLFLLRARKAG